MGGATGVAAVLLNRFFFLGGDLPSPTQSRADLLSLFACFFLVLEGVSRREVETKVAEKVFSKAARRGKGFSSALTLRQRQILDWATTTLRDSLPDADSVFVWLPESDRLPSGTVARLGSLGDDDRINPKAITIANALALKEATYLPDLQSLPARVDFPFLPKNAQAVLLLPFLLEETKGLLLIAADRKRAFSPRDQLWAQQFADRIGHLLLLKEEEEEEGESPKNDDERRIQTSSSDK